MQRQPKSLSPHDALSGTSTTTNHTKQERKMTSNLANNETIATNEPSASVQKKTLHERGISLTTLRYTRKEKDGRLNRCEVLLPTNQPILPELASLYSDTLKLCAAIRSKLASDCDADFLLVNREHRVVGCFSIELSQFSDRDLAWLNCVFAEMEGAVLAFVKLDEPSAQPQ
jgi:hypothetical protein